MLKCQAIIWKEKVCQALGDDAKANMPWQEFVKSIKAKYYAPRDIEKLVDEFLDMKKGD